MKLKILIVEDEPKAVQENKQALIGVAEEFGFKTNPEIRNDVLIDIAPSKAELNKIVNIDYDVIIIDLRLGDHKFEFNSEANFEEFKSFFKTDYFEESKFMICTADGSFVNKYYSNEKFRMDLKNIGIENVAEKSLFENHPNSIESQLKIVFNKVINEYLLIYIGKKAPLWKKKYFHDKKLELWKYLRNGYKKNMIILLVDISNSTDFVRYNSNPSPQFALELFKTFANNAHRIIESEKYKGFIERISGDEILAYFPIEYQEDLLVSHKVDKSSEYYKVLSLSINAAIEILKDFNQTVDHFIKNKCFKEYSKDNCKKPSLRVFLNHVSCHWVFLGSESKPQLSVMTEEVAETYRIFTHSESHGPEGNQCTERLLDPNNIYLSSYMTQIIEDQHLEATQEKLIRNFGLRKIYKLKKSYYEDTK